VQAPCCSVSFTVLAILPAGPYDTLPLICSSSANITLPQGRTKSYFETDGKLPTRGWKAIPSALDHNQQQSNFQNLKGIRHGVNPLTDRSLGIGAMHDIEP
jgi:hypothetical protein